MKLSKIITAGIVSTAIAASLAVGVAAESYSAYLCFQTTPYSFRNKHDDATYGEATKYFKDGVIVWGGNDPEAFPDIEDLYDYDIDGYFLPATFNDATIDKDGTYKVSVTDFDWARDGSQGFNLIFLDTTIPVDAGVKITNPKLLIDDEAVVEYEGEPLTNDDADAQGLNPTVIYDPDSKSTMCLLFANIWNKVITSYAGDKYPTSSLAIEFTVEGLGGGEADVPDDTSTDTSTEDNEGNGDANTDANTDNDKTDDAQGNVDNNTDNNTDTNTDKPNAETGVEGVAAVAGVAILAAAAAIVAGKTSKRK